MKTNVYQLVSGKKHISITGCATCDCDSDCGFLKFVCCDGRRNIRLDIPHNALVHLHAQIAKLLDEIDAKKGGNWRQEYEEREKAKEAPQEGGA